MKFQYLFLLIFTLSSLSCIRKDDTDLQCAFDCTRFEGNISRTDGVGLAGIEVLLEYKNNQAFSSYTRKIGRTTTNENGYYQMDVHLEDSEIGNSGGRLELSVQLHEIEEQLPDNFIKPNQLELPYYSYDENKHLVFIHNIMDRNEIITNNYFVPEKAEFQISLNDYAPVEEEDYFMYNVYIPYGFEDENFLLFQPEGRYATSPTTTYTGLSIVGEAVIQISKRKNGVIQENIHETITIEDTSTTPAVDFEY